MHTIIRIEHEDGWGMFRNRSLEEGDYSPKYVIGDSPETSGMFNTHFWRKPPGQDGIQMTEDMFCAFESLDSFNGLILPKELKFLLTKGYKVLMLDVTEIFKGEHQVCYRKKDIIQTKDISSLFI